jgi:hypothetical protein
MLQGGSQSDTVGEFTHGFVQSGTKAIQFRATQPGEMRILPSFDYNSHKPDSAEFGTSFTGYRDSSLKEDYKTRTPGFTSWYFGVIGYTFYGSSRRSFLSPLTGGNMNRKGVCPLNDVYNYCRNNQDPQVHSIMEKAEGDMNPRAQKPRVFGMMNVYYRDPETGDCENQIGIATQASLDLLKRNLAHRAGRGDPVLSEQWSDFLYGDVTDPMTGLTAFVRETPLDNNPAIKFAGIHFSSRPGYLDGSKPWAIDPSTDEGKAVLESRYNIQDTDDVTKLASYDDLLQYAVSDGEIPYEAIERACSPYAPNGMPSKAVGTVVSSPATTPAQGPEAAAQQATVSPVLSAVSTAENQVTTTTTVVNDSGSETQSSSTVENEESAELTSEEMAKYEAFRVKFKEDPNSLEASELPEYFSLCGKLKVSPV